MARLATNKRTWDGMQWVHDKRIWVDNGYTKVRVGQVWQDWDIRMRGSVQGTDRGRFRVAALMFNRGEFYAVVDRGSYLSSSGKEMKTWPMHIKIRRLRPNASGYKLLEDVE